MSTAAFLYRGAQRLLRASTPLLGGGGSKVARGLAGRRASAGALAAWARANRDTARPAAWLHAPSVGEGLQARAVLEALLEMRPGLQAAYTHFSPSAEALARRMPAGWAGYLPWDLPDEVGPALDALRPGVLAFTKTEAWPVLTAEAAARGIPVALVGGTVPPGSSRARWPARAFLRPTWGRLSLVAAISDADAEGFRALGVAAEALCVTGDPGIDSAAARARSADPAAPYLRPFHDAPRPTVVAGSTWPSDTAVLLPALSAARKRAPDVRVILAPHEPLDGVVRGLLSELEEAGWRAAALARVEEGGAEGVDAVVVDRVGVLAHLYTVGSVAYVGGGFHDAGLHSVLEPAAARLPVLFGPRHANARAASDLLAAGGAREATDARGLGDELAALLADEAARDYAAGRAFGYIDAHLGAARRTAALLDALMTAP